MLKDIIKETIPSKYYKSVLDYMRTNFNRYETKSYSQEGEDLIIKKCFENKQVGFYVDIGAHHPIRFSNTYLFYKKGWRGINIDAMPNSMKLFQRMRPRDINIEIPISDKNESLVYYLFDDPALNGFSKELSEGQYESNGHKIISRREMATRPLVKILDNYLPTGQEIDFLSIDVEGLDLQVLKSNDWQKYRPEVVLVEIIAKTYKEIIDSEIAEYLREKGYEIFARTLNTVLFRKVK